MSLRIVVHDVGHGLAIHAFTPNGQTVVVDLGCSDYFSPLEWLKDQTKTIDKLIITHPHGDHIDEIDYIAAHGFHVRQLWRPRWLPERDVRKANTKEYAGKLDKYFEINQRFTHPIPNDQLVGNPIVSGGVEILKFASKDCGTSNINNHSGVVVFSYQGVKVVVPGDNEPASWNILLQNPDFVSAISGAHVFLASHHGRESGYLSDLFGKRKIEPKLCLVSDGKVIDTDATSRYSAHAEGWDVTSRSSGQTKSRSCLTTRTDGAAVIEIGKQTSGNPYLSVTNS